ncbi:MAG: tetratricopeptide repeat protein [Clostridia bacterium]|nr:tetratricopeptide repeat protein [Clostridia bacterium]
MKFINLFIASSAEDLREDRLVLGNFIRALNDKYVKSDIYFRLFLREELPEALHPQAVTDSEYFYILFHGKTDKQDRADFETALDRFRATGAPKIFTLYKEVSGDMPEEVRSFLEHLDRDINHFYTTFQHMDTVKMKILLEMCTKPELHAELKLQDGEVLLNNDPMDINTENLPYYRNHEEIQYLREEIQDLEEEFSDILKRRAEHPDDPWLEKRRLKVSKRLDTAKKKLHKYEMELLKASHKLHLILHNGKKIYLRTLQALELLESGQAAKACALLTDEAFDADRRCAEEKAEVIKEDFDALVADRLTKIAGLKAQGITTGRAQEIRRLYEDARSLTIRHGLDLQCVEDYACFLYDQNDFTKGIEIAEQLYHNYLGRGLEKGAQWARICNLCGVLYSDIRQMKKAEDLYLEALSIRRHLSKSQPEAFLPDVAISCNNLATLYRNMQRFSEAEQLHLEALNIRRQLAKKTEAYLLDVAASCNNLANLYRDTQRLNEAEQLHLEALNIRRQLAEKHPEAFLPDAAQSCNNLAILYGTMRQQHNAEQFFLEALNIRRQLAEKHPEAFLPDVAKSCNNLAVLYSTMQRQQSAERFFLEALNIHHQLAEKQPEAFFPDVATSCNNLANLYRDTQRPNKAKQLYLEALNIHLQLAEQHPETFLPDVAKTCFNLGLLYNEIDCPADAFFEEALAIATCFKDTDPHCRQIYNALT